MGRVMDLLDDARRLGLTVRLDGDRLIVRGPKRAEATARALLASKAEVLDVLRNSPSTVYTFAANAEQNAQPVGVDNVDSAKSDFANIIVEDIEPGVDPWTDAEDWTGSMSTCSTCGTAALWLSMADKLHCQRCEPPTRAEAVIRRREKILRRLDGRTHPRPQAAASASPDKAADVEQRNEGAIPVSDPQPTTLYSIP